MVVGETTVAGEEIEEAVEAVVEAEAGEGAEVLEPLSQLVRERLRIQGGLPKRTGNPQDYMTEDMYGAMTPKALPVSGAKRAAL